MVRKCGVFVEIDLLAPPAPSLDTLVSPALQLFAFHYPCHAELGRIEWMTDAVFERPSSRFDALYLGPLARGLTPKFASH